ncbi:MAG TPA: hypothetical protein VLG41_05830, partial [Hydrogenophaga sp.]|uniref:hypothetical protein n=1 Tax=Hydrogenophaga sp. TaxID=1904254 RepID=UPI002BC5CBC6
GRVMVAAPWTDGTDTHSLSLLPDCLPGRGQATPAERIQKHLIDPMNAGLRKQHMSRKEASHWLKTVLRSCELADGAPLTPAIEAVLERAMSRSAKRKGERQDECRLSDLVVALRWLLRSRRAEELFQDKDPARNGLSVAVLNHLPFPVPKAIYAIDGWERPDRLRTFCYCPLARGIRHYNCQAIEGPTGVRGHSLSHQTQAFLFC